MTTYLCESGRTRRYMKRITIWVPTILAVSVVGVFVFAASLIALLALLQSVGIWV